MIMRAILTAAVLAATVLPASAGMVCGDRDTVVKVLAGGLGQHQAGFGVSGHGSLFELFVSADSGWTLIVSGPSGAACIVASGSGWESVPVLKPGSDA